MQNETTLSRRALLAGLGALPLMLSRPAPSRAEALPLVTVTKDPNCGCCDGWADHMKAAGFPVRVIVADDVFPLKARLGVPAALSSCHTAEVDGYVIEGHVPPAAVKRLLDQRPAATGLAVPGMPSGSPGMDFPGVRPEVYDVIVFTPSDQAPFMRFRGTKPV